MSQWTIRQAVVEERAYLEDLQRRSSGADPAYTELLRTHPEIVVLLAETITDGNVFVAERGGEIAGFAVLALTPEGEHELDGLFVEPALWGQGVGRALVEHCCAHVRQLGGRVLHLIGNPNVRGFYTTCGFDLLGSKPLQFGVGDVMIPRL